MNTYEEYVPHYDTLDDFFADQERLLDKEIAYLSQTGEKRQKIMDGVKVEFRNGYYIYAFESETELNIPDNTQIKLWRDGETFPALVINCEDFTIIIATTQYFGDEVAEIEFTAELWRLLCSLNDRLKELHMWVSPIVRSLILDGRKFTQPRKQIVTGQENAIQHSHSQPISFIWGPPGTGKTETLAQIALQHMKMGHRVLMLSYSNVSVDGAIMRVFKKAEGGKRGVMVRYGYPRDKELLHHEYLTAYNLALADHPELAREQTLLNIEKRRLPRTSPKYVEISKKLAQIREKLREEEKDAVRAARFVATTVSKAVVDGTLYEDRYDTVIFDEASMAYIPQIIFSAGLAKKHFICMGDFSQLPPIVQSSNDSSLNVDIFQYCGIVDAVQKGCAHQWLCMLDTQYRMHPDIAEFSGQKMYQGLLKTAPGVWWDRRTIAENAPLPGSALGVYDLSGMMSVCSKTADKSRINVLSAMISMGIAIQAAEKYGVGVISPYSAQSRLLHAMSRDIASQHPELKKITCATVHQFQGSESDVIVYDAVDCYLASRLGIPLTSMKNRYANRLYNVAVTRARGKMISVVNADYMRAKNLSKDLMFRQMIDETQGDAVIRGNEIISDCDSPFMKMGMGSAFGRSYLTEVSQAKSEVRIDIPGKAAGDITQLVELAGILNSLKQQNRTVIVRAESKAMLPEELSSIAIESPDAVNPITLIDMRIVWFGMPCSGANFDAARKSTPIRYRPVIRFEGRYFARALYGFLKMNNTIDRVSAIDAKNADGRYDTFSAYVSGEVRCPECNSPMRLIKSKYGRFFLGCSRYSECKHTEQVTEEMVDEYFYYNNRDGKRCPCDKTSLVPCSGRYGVYVCCGNAIEKHKYSLDKV